MKAQAHLKAQVRLLWLKEDTGRFLQAAAADQRPVSTTVLHLHSLGFYVDVIGLTIKDNPP